MLMELHRNQFQDNLAILQCVLLALKHIHPVLLVYQEHTCSKSNTSYRTRVTTGWRHALLRNEQHIQLLCGGQTGWKRVRQPVYQPEESTVLHQL